MKKTKRQVHSSGFKKKIALEALKSDDTTSDHNQEIFN